MVAAVLLIAMVAGVALAYVQPSRVEMVSKSATSNADAALAMELIKSAPHASVSYHHALDFIIQHIIPQLPSFELRCYHDDA